MFVELTPKKHNQVVYGVFISQGGFSGVGVDVGIVAMVLVGIEVLVLVGVLFHLEVIIVTNSS